MHNILSPRIHNLGDFAHCLPALSGLYKKTGQKMNFYICDRLRRFNGIKDLLKMQEMFNDVHFMDEIAEDLFDCIFIDDTGKSIESYPSPVIVNKYANFIRENFNIEFDVDDDFELKVCSFYPGMDYSRGKYVIGDRWSPSDAIDVDDRRGSYVMRDSGKFNHLRKTYLDYTKDLLYNCSLIKYNDKPFLTTVTGIAVLADLMKKDTYICWRAEDWGAAQVGRDVNWNGGKNMDTIFKDHFYSNRKTKLIHYDDMEFL